MNQITEISGVSPQTDEGSFDLTEDQLRATVRSTIEAMFEELADVRGRLRYDLGVGPAKGVDLHDSARHLR